MNLNKKQNKFLASLLGLLLIITVFGIFNPTTYAAGFTTGPDIGITENVPSHNQVRAYWLNHKSTAKKKIYQNGLQIVNSADEASLYSKLPDTENNSSVGMITDQAEADAIHYLNTFRYSVGLDEVTMDKDKIHYAQSASFMSEKNGFLCHFPETPSDMKDTDQIVIDGKLGARSSNLSMGVSFTEQIRSYMADSSSNNIKTAGHRTWLLLPEMETIGIGQVGSSGAAYVFDNPYVAESDDKVTAYPNKASFAEWMDEGLPFSVQLGGNYDIENASASVLNLSTKEVTNYTAGTNLYVNYGYGPNSLVFGSGTDLSANSKYRVRIDGVTKDGIAYPIEYSVDIQVMGGLSTVYEYEARYEDVAYKTEERQNPNLPKGTKKYIQIGKNGYDYVAYRVEYLSGKEMGRTVYFRENMEAPVTEIVEIGTGPEIVYLKGISNIRDAWGNIVDEKVGGEVIRPIEFIDGKYHFREDGQDRYIYASLTTFNERVGKAYANGTSNIRDAKTGQVVASIRIGDYIEGIQRADGWIYFYRNGRQVKVWADILTYARAKSMYFIGTSNIRNQNYALVDERYKGELVKAVHLEKAPYFRYIEDGQVRLVYESLLSSRTVAGSAFVCGTTNVRSAATGNIIGKLRIGSYIHGNLNNNGWIYFQYNGQDAKVYAGILEYAKEKTVTVIAHSNVRNQSLSVVGSKKPGEVLKAVDLGTKSPYFRFIENGNIRLIHESLVK